MDLKTTPGPPVWRHIFTGVPWFHMRLYRQRFIAVWACTYRSCHEIMFQLHFPGHVPNLHTGTYGADYKGHAPLIGTPGQQDCWHHGMPPGPPWSRWGGPGLWEAGLKNYPHVLWAQGAHFTAQPSHLTPSTHDQAPAKRYPKAYADLQLHSGPPAPGWRKSLRGAAGT